MGDRRLVLDLETKRSFDDVGGRNHLEKLGVSVVGVYDYSTGEYRAYLEGDFGSLQNLLIDASLIVGFNHVSFDLPVIQPYLSVDVTKLPVFDIMLDLEKRLGHRVGLDGIAAATLGAGKTATGLDAIRYYREGRWEELKAYCLHDVKITRDVLEYGLREGKIFYTSRFGREKKSLKVDWSAHEGRAVLAATARVRAAPAQYALF